MNRTTITLVTMFSVLTASIHAWATVPDQIPIQGLLADEDGAAIEGATDITFALYDSQVDGTPLWSDTFTDIDIIDGFFTVYLGSGAALDFASLLTYEEIWLGVTVESDSEMDRVHLVSTPFSVEAEVCRAVGSLTESDINTNFSTSSHDHDDDYAALIHIHDDDYADVSHNHDGEYVSVDGGIMTGQLNMTNNNITDVNTLEVTGTITTPGGSSTNWNTAFGWGDHGEAGYITASSTDLLTNKSGSNSMWTNDEGYITETSTNTLTNKSGSNSMWTNDEGYITADSADALTNKTGNISMWTNDQGYITETSTNTLTNKSGSNSMWTNDEGYISAGSSDELTNKTGNISMWTNDAAYITASSMNTLTNKAGSNSMWTNDEGYISASSTDTLTNKSGSNSMWTNDENYVHEGDTITGLVRSTSTSDSYFTGSLGIGYSSPSYELDVNGTARVMGDFIVSGSDVYDDSGTLRLSGEDDIYITMDYADNDTSSTIRFGMDSMSTPTELMRLTQTGRLGIGNNNPQYTLDVDGSGYFNGNVTANGSVTANTFIAEMGQLTLKEGDLARWYLRYPAGGGFEIYQAYNAADAEQNTARFNISDSGSVGIGTDAPDAQLEIEGDGDQGIRVTSTDREDTFLEFVRPGATYGDWRIRDFTGNLYFDFDFDDGTSWDSRFIFMTNGDMMLGIGSTNGCIYDGNLDIIAGTCASDKRLKKDIRPLGDTLKRLVELEPVFYRYRNEGRFKDMGEDEHLGLVAQQVEQSMPELVETNAEGYRVVRYSELPILTLQAVREQNQGIQAIHKAMSQQVATLKQENQSLHRENVKMRTRLESIEARLETLDGSSDVPKRTNLGWLVPGIFGLGAVVLAGRRIRRS